MATKTIHKKTVSDAPPRVEMKKTELIPIGNIVLSQLEPQIRRRSHFKPVEITELADSIKQHGLINPITVRPWKGVRNKATGKFKGEYELVAGERRLLATKEAGYDSIEAIVRDLSDEATIEIQLIENLKRVDVDPLDEAFSYQYLIENAEMDERGSKRPYTVADIAAKFARTEELILRRLKLVDLCDEGKKDLGDGFLPLAHAELLARFPIATQEKLLKDNIYNYSWQAKEKKTAGAVSLASLQQAVTDNNAKRIIASAKFDPKDATLRADGLTCPECPKRTGYSPKLFSDTALGNKDTCLDQACWDGKLKAMLVQKREKLALDLPNPKNLPLKELVMLVPCVKKSYGDYYGHRDVGIGKALYVANTYNKKTYKEAKKKNECPNVEKALRVGGNGIGASTFICRVKNCKTHGFKEQSSSYGNSYNYEADRLKGQERKLNVSIADEVRIPLIKKKVEQYSDTTWVFNNDKGRRFLLASILTCDNDFLGQEFAEILPKEIAKNRYAIKDYFAMVANWDAATVSRMLALICFETFGQSDYGDVGNQESVKQLAAEFGENYDVLAAEARVKLTPTEGGHRAAAQAHLDAIKAGKKSKTPTVFWPRPKVKAEKKPKAKAKTKAVAK